MKTLQTGYTLIELSISLTIISLLLTGGLGMVSKIGDAARYRTTNERLAQIEEALAAFVAANQYLPCPAMGKSVETSTAFGVATPYDGTAHSCNSTNLTGEAGMVPVRTLNIPDMLSYDGWGRKITYRISGGFGNSTDFSNSTYRGNLHITDIAGNEKTTVNRLPPTNIGGAYVLISGGPNGNGTHSAIAALDPTDTGRASENKDHSANRVYVQNERTSEFSDILVYKRKSDFKLIAIGESPINIPSYVCSNAGVLGGGAALTQLAQVNATTAKQTETSAKALYLLCQNQPSVCDMTPEKVFADNLMLWLDANDPSADGSGQWNPPFWKDKSGHYDNRKTIIGPVPLNFVGGAINGKSVMRFAYSEYINVNMDFLKNTPYTIFVLYTHDDTTAPAYFMGGDPGFNFGYTGQTVLQLAQTSTENVTVPNIPYQPYVPIIAEATLNTSGSGKTLRVLQGDKVYVNGSDNRTAMISNISMVSIGKAASSKAGTVPFVGDIGEIIVYNTALSVNDRTAIEGYLYRKWVSGECW